MTTIDITASEAIDILAETFGKDSYKIKALRKELAQLEAQPILDRFRETYSSSWWAYGDDLSLRTSRTFKDRKEAKNWIDEQNLGEAEFAKFSFCDKEGSPMTECSLTVKGTFEDIPYEVCASYTRPGMSTAHCKVVPSTSYSVICELP